MDGLDTPPTHASLADQQCVLEPRKMVNLSKCHHGRREETEEW